MERLLGIQLARGIAALVVTIYHAGRMLALPQYLGGDPLGSFFGFWHAGVDFFFVLSGFIIYLVHHGDLGQPAALKRYAWRRVTRIYPIYWVVCAIILMLDAAKPGGAELPEAGYLVRSLLLVPQGPEPLLGVAWTLEHEVTFYVVFGLAILSRRLGIAVFAGWMALVVYGLAVPLGPVLLKFLASPYHLDFLMGAVTAYITLHRPVRYPLSLVGIGLAGFLAAGLAENGGVFALAGPVSQVCFGLSASLIILGLAVAEHQGRLRFGTAGAFAGAASYTLYLVHTIVIGLTARVLMIAGLVHGLHGALALVATVLGAVVAAGLIHQFVERPLNQALASVGRTYVYGGARNVSRSLAR
jgi:exopolysaccharide production protein ExoZ